MQALNTIPAGEFLQLNAYITNNLTVHFPGVIECRLHNVANSQLFVFYTHMLELVYKTLLAIT